jgi:hypothetical protein
MPSLFQTVNGVSVAANYGRMVPQQTYGVGESLTNFGTRQLAVISVTIGGTAADVRYQDGATSSLSFNLSNSVYSAAVRTLQSFGEIYAVYSPVATGFIAIVALDTLNSSESGNGVTTGQIATTYGLAEAAIAAAVNGAKASATKDSTCTIAVPTMAIGTTL